MIARTRIVKYAVENYGADGIWIEPRSAFFNTLKEARAEVRTRLGSLRARKYRYSGPDSVYVVEGYNEFPPSHPRADGCGGILISRL